MATFLHQAANDHLTLEFGDASDAHWQAVVQKLENQFGLTRTGNHIHGGDSTIYQNFTCDQFTLAAGWDTWSGNYLLANSTAGDDFLTILFEAIRQDLPISE